MKVAAFISLAFLAAALPAAAQTSDAGTRFSGLSLGANAGGAWGRAKYGTDSNCPPVAIDAVFCNSAPDPSFPNGQAVNSSGSGKMSPGGLTGGLQAGYHWQAGRNVVGAELDFAALDFNETATSTAAFPFPFLGTQYTVTSQTKVSQLSTLRARLGMTVTPDVLLYATGGAAFGRIQVSGSYSDNAMDVTFPGGSGSASNSSWKTGWVLGAGAQWALDRRWSLKAEYLYADFGKVSVGVPVTNTPAFAQTITSSADVSLHLVRVGLDYRF